MRLRVTHEVGEAVTVGTAGGAVSLDVRVPDNVTAHVSLPAAAGQRYLASGEGAPRYEGTRDGRALFTIGSGSTRFRPA